MTFCVLENQNRISKKEIVRFLKRLGIEVKTSTKARGHQGFFLKNRIDVSNRLTDERAAEVLVHEFAHYINEKIEGNIAKTGGSLEVLFPDLDTKTVEKELLKVTEFVDKNSRLLTLKKMKEDISSKIKKFQEEIKLEYPDFKRSEEYKPFKKYFRHSNAKYLLKYDRVKIVSPFLRRVSILSVRDVEQDFTELPPALINYIKLRSYQRKQSRVQRRICKLKAYYKRPSELFARFVESLFVDKTKTVDLAPFSSGIFFKNLENGYYYELKDLFMLF